MEDRIRLLSATGIDAIVILQFDEALARLTARQFVEWVLGDALGIAGLHEGGNFRFGNKAEAGIIELAEFGQEFGFRLTVHPAVHVHGLEVSSSVIRNLVSDRRHAPRPLDARPPLLHHQHAEARPRHRQQAPRPHHQLRRLRGHRPRPRRLRHPPARRAKDRPRSLF